MNASRSLLLTLMVPGVLATITSPAAAIPASPNPFQVHNQDGSSVMVRMLGDEHLSWMEDLEGYRVAFDPQRGAWCYARQDGEGRSASTGLRVGQVDPQTLALPRHQRPADVRVRHAMAMRALGAASMLPVPMQGEVRNLVLLVKFSNQRSHFSKEQFEELFNGPTNSVQEYYREVSNGRMNIVSTVVDWIPLPYEDSHYAYNSEVQNGHPEQMVVDALAYLDAQGFDFTPFDADHDGVIDAVDVIHSGYGYEYTGQQRYIHSHFSDLGRAGISFSSASGKSIVAYHTEPEYGPNMRSVTMLGVICHETAHFFGVPDLYDYGYDSAGLGAWSLMAAGAWTGPNNDGTRPTHPDAWTAAKLGFVEVVPLPRTRGDIRLAPVMASNMVLRIDGALESNEYFLLENRQKTGYDTYLPGHGLLIYHVDENQPSNDDQDHYLVDLEQADGLRELNRRQQERGDDGDAFPTASADAFTPYSRPDSNGYSGISSKIHVVRIREVDREILFDVILGNPAARGQPCSTGLDCVTGSCVSGVCCNSACGDGVCGVCSVAAGAQEDGTCKLLSGTACEDGNLCTTGDVCRDGVCEGSAKTCQENGCQASVQCDPSTGLCVGSPVNEGQACDDGNACTTLETCQSGVCGNGQMIDCTGECRAGTCEGATGTCTPVPDGTTCSAGTCQGGQCIPDKEADDGSSPCACAQPQRSPAWLGGVFLVLLLAVTRRRGQRL